VAELYPGYQVTLWQGLFAPVGTPDAVIARLRSEVGAILAQPDIAEKLSASGSGAPYVSTPEAFAARIRSDHARYGTLIRGLGISVE
jgi:tripartite-type tricarboxylate transporter receptor subunit TctC